MKPLLAILLLVLTLAAFGQGASYRSSGCYNHVFATNCKDSTAIFEGLLKAEPNNAYYYMRLAQQQYGCRHVDAAIKSCNQGIGIDSNRADLFATRATIYMYIGKLRNALHDAQNAVRLDSTDARFWCTLAAAYFEYDVYDSIMPAINKALKLKPDHYEGICYKAMYLKHVGKDAEALVELNKAIKLKPESSYAYLISISAYSGLKKYKEAIAAIDKVLSIDTCYTELYYYKGVYYSYWNKPDLSMKYYTISIEKHPRSMYAHYYRAWLYDKKGETNKAGEDFLQAAIYGYDNAIKVLETRYPNYYTKYLEQRKK